MVKTVQIKLEDQTWEQFKKLAKARGRTLEFAVQELFFDALEEAPLTAGTVERPTETALQQENQKIIEGLSSVDKEAQ